MTQSVFNSYHSEQAFSRYVRERPQSPDDKCDKPNENFYKTKQHRWERLLRGDWTLAQSKIRDSKIWGSKIREESLICNSKFWSLGKIFRDGMILKFWSQIQHGHTFIWLWIKTPNSTIYRFWTGGRVRGAWWLDEKWTADGDGVDGILHIIKK